MTTMRGFTVGKVTGRRMWAPKIIRWWKRRGMAPWLTVRGLENGCLPKPSGKKPHGAPMAENIHGETRSPIGVERISVRVGMISDPSGAYRKARVPMVFWIYPEMAGNGSAALISLIHTTQKTDARI